MSACAYEHTDVSHLSHMITNNMYDDYIHAKINSNERIKNNRAQPTSALACSCLLANNDKNQHYIMTETLAFPRTRANMHR